MLSRPVEGRSHAGRVTCRLGRRGKLFDRPAGMVFPPAEKINATHRKRYGG
jgi:hypothetical protein